MTTQAALDAVIKWFARVKLASLEMPKGWFGRPYDNLHQLTWWGATDHKLLLELDRQLLLVITDPSAVEVTDSELRINECAQVVLDWQEYGNLRPHADNHGPGSVRLVAQGATFRR
jgi:hypothetical protein